MATVLGLTLGSETRAAPPASPPRYRLSVGQRLVYEGKEKYQYDKSGGEGRDTVAYSVARLNSDGTWHVVAETCSWAIPSDPKLETVLNPGVISFDLAADGRMTNRRAWSVVEWARHDPALVFPRLPADAGPAPWQVDEGGGVLATYRLGPATRPGVAAIEVARGGPAIEVFGGTRGSRAWFDVGRGRVTREESWDTTSYRSPQSRRVATDLAADETRPAEKAADIGREIDACLDAVAAADELILASADGDTDAKLARAMAVLRAARAAASLPAAQNVLRDRIESLEGSAERWKHDAAERAAVVAKPAPDWDLADLEGRRHRLRDLRGKVVVLDFWFRGCASCIAAAPHLAQVAGRYKDDAVAVFGVNVDRDPADARAVAAAVKFPYPTLRDDPTSGGLSTDKAYHVEMYPTVVVIGPDGVVRHLHVGNEDDLGERLSGEIRRLLPAPTTIPAPAAGK